MGQGLYTKVAQVVAEEFQVDIDRGEDHRDHDRQGAEHLGDRRLVRLRPQRHGGAGDAARQIKERLDRLRRRAMDRCRAEQVDVPARTACASATSEIPFAELVNAGLYRAASSSRPPASTRRRRSTGTAPPARGRPFYYFAYGAAVQRGVDRHADRREPGRARRHPARRRPLAEPGDRPRPDRGRLHPGHGLADHRGAVVGRQGPAAHPRALAPTRSPACATGPTVFNVRSGGPVENREATIHRSKAVGEPPLMLAISVFAGALRRGGQRRRLQGLPAARRAGDAGARADGGRADAEGCLAMRRGVGVVIRSSPSPPTGGGAPRGTTVPHVHLRPLWGRLRAGLSRVLRPGRPLDFPHPQPGGTRCAPTSVRGSTPREAGPGMLVTERDIAGTIGGGQLEWRAVERARELLAEAGATRRARRCRWGPPSSSAAAADVAVTLAVSRRAVRERLAERDRGSARTPPARRPFRRRACRPRGR